ncbi:MAG: hypothetical protein O3A46_03430 [Candidatus Poribacteria bacterium]|nr:hypothetical protein [Candidatus Poribacteria bacterium]
MERFRIGYEQIVWQMKLTVFWHSDETRICAHLVLKTVWIEVEV